MAKKAHQNNLQALRVPQWLADWDEVAWDPKSHRREPEHWFYLISMSAADLKALSGIYPRNTANRTRGTDDLGIQRRHEEGRSAEIGQFIKYGYPWSDLNQQKRSSGEYDDLRKPGWLPTAIVVNILTNGDKRLGNKVAPDDLMSVTTNDSEITSIQLPKHFSGAEWRPKALPPIEVIDGQHRLWAFDSSTVDGDFHVPVVAFHGLDLSWQAYLFYTINIKPKKINASLAYDLYPLLRTEDWLDKFEGHIIYRETRSQELVDILWSHRNSPWHQRINMLGEPGQKGKMVTQASWVRTLLATFVKSSEGPRVTIGGLFGAPVGSHNHTLSWSRSEQAAFLIVAGQSLHDSVSSCKESWAVSLRKQEQPQLLKTEDDYAFYGPKTLINQDQGMRAFLHVINDFCFLQSDELDLTELSLLDGSGEDVSAEVDAAIKVFKQSKTGRFLRDLCECLAKFDWRTSDAPDLKESERLLRAAFRGSGGYKELRKQLLAHLAGTGGVIAATAQKVTKALGYN